MPGDAVALMISQQPGRAGAIVRDREGVRRWVPINVQSRGENLGYIFNHAGPKLVIAEAELQATIAASGAESCGGADGHDRDGAGDRG